MKQDDATEGKCARRGGDGGCLGQGAGCGAPLGREDVAEQVNGAEEHAIAHRVRDDVQPCHARREQAFDEDHEVALHSRVVGGVDAAYKRRGSCARQGVWHARRTCDLATDRPTAVDEGAARGGSAGVRAQRTKLAARPSVHDRLDVRGKARHRKELPARLH